MLYYYVASRDLDGGAIITASHNPKEYNGIKMVRRGALALSGDAGIKEIKEAIVAGRFADEGREAGAAREDAHHRRRLRRALPLLHRRARRCRRSRSSSTPATAWARWGPAAIFPRLPVKTVEDVLRAGRDVPQPPARPARGGEPARDHGARRRGEGRPRDRLGRRRRPLLLHRRHRRLRARRLRHRAPGRALRAARSRGPRSSTTCAPPAPSRDRVAARGRRRPS